MKETLPWVPLRMSVIASINEDGEEEESVEKTKDKLGNTTLPRIQTDGTFSSTSESSGMSSMGDENDDVSKSFIRNIRNEKERERIVFPDIFHKTFADRKLTEIRNLREMRRLSYSSPMVR